jgi:hypothetical protein
MSEPSNERQVSDAKDLVRARLERIVVPEPVTTEMSDAEVEAAMRRVVYRLLHAVQHR